MVYAASELSRSSIEYVWTYSRFTPPLCGGRLLDGQDWVTLVDRRNNYKDVPNDYVQGDNPARVRYVRYKNIEVPTPHLAISDLRVFGIGEGKKPATVKNFKGRSPSGSP